jgi:hypothetical protein
MDKKNSKHFIRTISSGLIAFLYGTVFLNIKTILSQYWFFNLNIIFIFFFQKKIVQELNIVNNFWCSQYLLVVRYAKESPWYLLSEMKFKSYGGSVSRDLQFDSLMGTFQSTRRTRKLCKFNVNLVGTPKNTYIILNQI